MLDILKPPPDCPTDTVLQPSSIDRSKFSHQLAIIASQHALSFNNPLSTDQPDSSRRRRGCGKPQTAGQRSVMFSPLNCIIIRFILPPASSPRPFPDRATTAQRSFGLIIFPLNLLNPFKLLTRFATLLTVLLLDGWLVGWLLCLFHPSRARCLVFRFATYLKPI